MSGNSELVTAREAAKRLGINRAQVSKLITTCELPAQKVGRDWIIDVREIEKFKDLPKTRPHLSNLQVVDIKMQYSIGMSISELAKLYKVSERTIYRNIKQ